MNIGGITLLEVEVRRRRERESDAMELKQYTFNVHITGRVNAEDDSDAVARIRGLAGTHVPAYWAGVYQDGTEWIEIEQVSL